MNKNKKLIVTLVIAGIITVAVGGVALLAMFVIPNKKVEKTEVTETEAPAATGGSKEEILPLLQSASALTEADAAANKAAILTLLTQAKEKAEGSYPDAASVIGGAITLLDTDSPDGASVLSLLNSATTILG